MAEAGQVAEHKRAEDERKRADAAEAGQAAERKRAEAALAEIVSSSSISSHKSQPTYCFPGNSPSPLGEPEEVVNRISGFPVLDLAFLSYSCYVFMFAVILYLLALLSIRRRLADARNLGGFT